MALAGDSDKNLIGKAQRGDSLAYASLMRRYQQRTEIIIAHHVNDDGVIHDLRQEVFIKVYQNLNQFKQHSSFYTWLYRITRNTVYNYLKYHAGERNSIKVDMVCLDNQGNSNSQFNEAANPEMLSIGDELLRELSLAFDALPQELRLCISLREFDGLSYEQIAKQLHCPIGTVRSRIHRARLILKSSLSE